MPYLQFTETLRAIDIREQKKTKTDFPRVECSVSCKEFATRGLWGGDRTCQRASPEMQKKKKKKKKKKWVHFFVQQPEVSNFFPFAAAIPIKLVFPNKEIRDLAAPDAKDLDEHDEDGKEKSLTAK